MVAFEALQSEAQRVPAVAEAALARLAAISAMEEAHPSLEEDEEQQQQHGAALATAAGSSYSLVPVQATSRACSGSAAGDGAATHASSSASTKASTGWFGWMREAGKSEAPAMGPAAPTDESEEASDLSLEERGLVDIAVGLLRTHSAVEGVQASGLNLLSQCVPPLIMTRAPQRAFCPPSPPCLIME